MSSNFQSSELKNSFVPYTLFILRYLIIAIENGLRLNFVKLLFSEVKTDNQQQFQVDQCSICALHAHTYILIWCTHKHMPTFTHLRTLSRVHKSPLMPFSVVGLARETCLASPSGLPSLPALPPSLTWIPGSDCSLTGE